MRLLFVNPPLWFGAQHPSQRVIDNLASYPPVGVLYISAYLKKYCQVEIRLFDYGAAPRNDYDAIAPVLFEFAPDLIGIPTYTMTLFDVFTICKRIRSLLPTAKIVLGGHHARFYPVESLQHDSVDYVVAGEGEAPMRGLIEAMSRGENYPNLTGLWFKKEGKIVDGGIAPRIQDLAGLPYLDYTLAGTPHHYLFGSGSNEAFTISSRGCPEGCAYCASVHKDKQFIVRPPDDIIEELKLRSAEGYRLVHFFDDNFNAHPERVKALCRGIIKERLPISWTMRGNAATIDEELIDLLVRSGCARINIGIESACESLLRAFNRKSDLEHAIRMVKLMARAGLTVMGYFMVGFPGETRAMASKTIALAESLPLDYALFMALCAMPGSEFYARLLREHKVRDVYREQTLEPRRNFKLLFYEDQMSEAEALALCRLAYRRVYLRPSMILRHLKKLQNPAELYYKAKVGAMLLRYVAGK